MSRYEAIRAYSPTESAVIDTFSETIVKFVTGVDREARAWALARQCAAVVDQATTDGTSARIVGGWRTHLGDEGHPNVALARTDWTHREPAVQVRANGGQWTDDATLAAAIDALPDDVKSSIDDANPYT